MDAGELLAAHCLALNHSVLLACCIACCDACHVAFLTRAVLRTLTCGSGFSRRSLGMFHGTNTRNILVRSYAAPRHLGRCPFRNSLISPRFRSPVVGNQLLSVE